MDIYINGQKEAEKMLEKYGNIPIVRDLWVTRKKSNLIKWLMSESNVSSETIAGYLNCSVAQLNNKFNRNAFSIDDLILAATACNYSIVLQSNANPNYGKVIEPCEYFKEYDNDIYERLQHITEFLSQRAAELKRAEYEKKLAALKAEYGVKD